MQLSRLPLAFALVAVCFAQDAATTASTAAAGEAVVAPDPKPDPLAVHPLFGAAVPAGEYEPMTNDQRLRLFVRQTFTTVNPWFRTVVSAGIAHAQGRQYSWGGGVAGYSHRFGSQYATYVLRNSFLSLGAWGLQHDTRYVPSRSRKVPARIGHAIMQNFLTVNRDGKTTLHLARILSGYGAGIIATNWQPHAKWSAQGLRAGNEQLIYGAAFGVGREFAAEVNHLLQRVFHH